MFFLPFTKTLGCPWYFDIYQHSSSLIFHYLRSGILFGNIQYHSWVQLSKYVLDIQSIYRTEIVRIWEHRWVTISIRMFDKKPNFPVRPDVSIKKKTFCAERAWFKVSFLFGEWKKNPGCLIPRSVPRSGENPAVKKSQHKSPLIFFYATPPFSGLAFPI